MSKVTLVVPEGYDPGASLIVSTMAADKQIVEVKRRDRLPIDLEKLNNSIELSLAQLHSCG